MNTGSLHAALSLCLSLLFSISAVAQEQLNGLARVKILRATCARGSRCCKEIFT
jgi:hypothetical protein